MIWYVYPQWHKVSFTLIAEKHIQYLKNYVRIERIDELAFPHIYPHSKPLVLLHPTFYPLSKYGSTLERKLPYYRGIIGFDVADSTRISNLAVSMTHYTTAMIVPSSFCKKAYIESGVRVPVYVVHHGLDLEWYETPKLNPKNFRDLHDLKKSRNLKFLLFFCIHSEYRKGADLVIDFYTKLKRERNDVVLVLKCLTPDGVIQPVIKKLGGIVVAGWLSEKQKMELYDLADIYLLFSRGGGFEHNGLEALGRAVPVIAPKGGSWEDYMPEWLLVDSHPCPYVLKDNPIHVGKGVEIDVDKAVDLACEILDNTDEYKAKVEEFRDRFLKERFTWEKIAKQILNIIYKYY